MNVLLSAYACEPGKGSEPGVGWRWVEGLAGRVDLTVITRSNNQVPIEKTLKERASNDPIHKVKFMYHDLPLFAIYLKKLRILTTLSYYIFWQWSISKTFRELAESSHIVHHLTFCTALCPGFWNGVSACRVIGPVAAPLVNPHYLKLFGCRAWIQRVRNLIIRNFLRIPWLKKSFKEASAVFPANSEMKDLLTIAGIGSNSVMLDTGSPVINSLTASQMHSNDLQSGDKSSCTFMYAGVLERRKGLEMALRAFAIVKEEKEIDWRFNIIGDGPDRKRLERLTVELGLSSKVDFQGRIPHYDVASNFRTADVFLFPSVRDASGGVNLEAMAAGLPILCISHQGIADIVDDSCSYQVAPGSIAETIVGLAAGIRLLALAPIRCKQLGLNAQNRATVDFNWQNKFDRMVEIYREIVADYELRPKK